MRETLFFVAMIQKALDYRLEDLKPVRNGGRLRIPSREKHGGCRRRTPSTVVTKPHIMRQERQHEQQVEHGVRTSGSFVRKRT